MASDSRRGCDRLTDAARRVVSLKMAHDLVTS